MLKAMHSLVDLIKKIASRGVQTNNSRSVLDTKVVPGDDNIYSEELINTNDPNLNKIVRPCHYYQLFIKSDGNIYPCCRVWNRDDMLIGNIVDHDIFTKIIYFKPSKCQCNKYIIRHNLAGDIPKYFNLNVELSLLCQARCAMCCVNAPGWKGTYDLYDNIENLILRLSPIDKLVFQGGEVLVQSQSLDFIRKLKKLSGNKSELSIITNGNAGEQVAIDISNIVDRVMISFVGFQDETYRKIMGIDLGKTISFVERLKSIGKVKLILKYLTTPINYHEQNLFLRWAINMLPNEIVICDANWKAYINSDTNDKYWQKIIDRTTKSVIDELCNVNNELIRRSGTVVYIENLKDYKIDSEFIAQNNLAGILKEYDT